MGLLKQSAELELGLLIFVEFRLDCCDFLAAIEQLE